MAMMEPEEKKVAQVPHNIILESRKALTATGVSNVDSFNEEMIVAYTSLGELVITGEELHINKLNMETGELTLEGTVISMTYSDAQPQKGGGVFSKLFR